MPKGKMDDPNLNPPKTKADTPPAEGYELRPVASGPPAGAGYDPSDAAAALGLGKKRSKTRIVVIVLIIVIIAAVAVGLWINSTSQSSGGIYAETSPVETGTIQQTLNTSGVLTTGKRVTVFSPANAPLTTVNAEQGQVVEKGDPLFTFDTTELKRSYEQAVATSRISGLQAQSQQSASNKSQQEMNDAQASINDLQGRKNTLEAQATDLENQLGELQARYAAQNIDIEGMRTELELLKAEYKKAPSDALKKQILALEGQLAQLEGPLQQAQASLSANQEEITYLDGEITQMEATRDAAEAAVLDDAGKAQLEAQGTSDQLALDAAADALNAAQAGVTAPITGVVTELTAETGSLATQYGPLCIIESLKKVDVIISLSRYDLEQVKVGQKATITTLGKEYAGKVTKIDAITTESVSASGSSSSFINATVSVSKPKEIKLGIEATVEIITGTAENVLTVPINAVNTDVDGTYVFVDEGGIARRKAVTLGLSSDTTAEVESGLEAGDKVILSSQNMYDGAVLSDNPADVPAQDMMGMMMG